MFHALFPFSIFFTSQTSAKLLIIFVLFVMFFKILPAVVLNVVHAKRQEATEKEDYEEKLLRT